MPPSVGNALLRLTPTVGIVEGSFTHTGIFKVDSDYGEITLVSICPSASECSLNIAYGPCAGPVFGTLSA